MNSPPPLKSPHSDSFLIESRLEQLRKLSTEQLITSLTPDTLGALRVRTDGMMINGDHRIEILRERGVDVDALPREIWKKIS